MVRWILLGVVVMVALVLTVVSPRAAPSSSFAHVAGPAKVEDRAAGPLDPGPVRTEDVPVPGDVAAVVVRGARVHRTAMVFLAGYCNHPGGFVMSFQHTAAARGDLVSVQGDEPCPGPWGLRRWSYDLEKMDRRIDAAFRAAGHGEPRGVIVIGYSQGAERAEKLVARWPEKYSAAVLMGTPVVPSARLLARADAVALMAGTFDAARGPMRAAVPSLERAGIPAAFFSIPGARHGGMGEHPEDTMREALDFVEEKRAVARSLKKDAGGPSHEGPGSR